MALLLFTFANEKIISKIVSVELRAQNIYSFEMKIHAGCHRSLMVCIDVRHLYQSHRQLSNGASADLLI